MAKQGSVPKRRLWHLETRSLLTCAEVRAPSVLETPKKR